MNSTGEQAEEPSAKQGLIAALIAISHSFSTAGSPTPALELAEKAKQTITTIADPKFQGVTLNAEVMFVHHAVTNALAFGGLRLDDAQHRDWDEFNRLTTQMRQDASSAALNLRIKP